MFRLKYIGQYVLALLLLILVALQIWTWYLGTGSVTFKRLVGSEPYAQIDDLSLRRYAKNAISPHLFTLATKDEKTVLKQLTKDCDLKPITPKELPEEAGKTDPEMVDVIKKSPYIYLRKHYDLSRPKEGRMCLVFRDKSHLYLFMNGNL